VLDIVLAEAGPGFGDTSCGINPLNPAVQVDKPGKFSTKDDIQISHYTKIPFFLQPGVIMEVVGRVIDVERGDLVLQVELELVARVPVGAELLVNLLQGSGDSRFSPPLGHVTRDRGAVQTSHSSATNQHFYIVPLPACSAK
jgi:hypothetical protein